MPAVNTKQIQELRRRTGAGMLHCKSTLEATKGDLDQAVERLRLEGVTKAETRSSRRTSEGVIASYIHHNGKLAALVEVNCETDFVARTNDFANLAQQLAEHIAAAAPIAVSRDALARDLAEHIAAAAPLAVRRDELNPELVTRRRREFESQLRMQGKPEHLVSGFVEVKMRQFLQSIVLMEQTSIREPSMSIAQLVDEVSESLGETVQIRRFSRFHMGLA